MHTLSFSILYFFKGIYLLEFHKILIFFKNIEILNQNFQIIKINTVTFNQNY